MLNKNASPINRFLLWLASADTELLRENNADKRKFQLIGLSIIGTWIFAMLAWAYFFSTVSSSPLIILCGSALMGFIVLTIDRVLIAGLQGGHAGNSAGPIIFRVALALCLGAFMAQPALLYLFEKDVAVQLLEDKEIKKQITVAEIQRSLAPQREPLLFQLDSIQKLKNNLDSNVVALRNSFLQEADGSGGTGKVGIATIAKAKKQQLDDLKMQADDFSRASAPMVASLQSRIDALTASADKKIAGFDAQAGNGFLARIEALQHLIDNNLTLRWRYLLLLAIIMLIELAQVLSKLLLKTNIYNQRLLLEENYLISLDREIFERKYKESQKYADSVHQHNLASINLIMKNVNSSHTDGDHAPEQEYTFNSQQPPSTNGMLSYFKNKLMGRHI